MTSARKSRLPLLAKLEIPETKALQAAPCAMSVTRVCCGGRGYHLNKKGPYTGAVLCHCVQSCMACLGKLNRLQDDRAIPCRKPSPRAIVNIVNDCHLPARYLEANFLSFKNQTGNCGQNRRKIQVWAEGFTHGDKGLLISGPVGVGKTYLLACIAKTLAAKGIRSRFVDFFQLINEIKGAYSDRKSDQSILAPLINVDVLIIDELGKGRNTEFELTILDQVIMGRYNQSKTIVASTNYDLNPANQSYDVSQKPLDGPPDNSRGGRFAPLHFGPLEARVDTRIYSRLMETTQTVNLEGDDFRTRLNSPHS